MRKRVFGSIFLTSLVTLLLTTGLLLLAVHAGLTNDMRQRLVTESSYLSAVDNIREELEKFGSVYADRLTLVAQDGTVLYDNRTNASEMENHAVRPEIAAAEKNGTGEDNRLSETFAKQTFYYAVRLKNGDVLRISATADSVFGALSSASPWIVLIILLALLVAALLAGWLTGLFLKPIEALDLHDPMKGEAYDELSPLLHRMDKQNRKIQAQMDELRRRQTEFTAITENMSEGFLVIDQETRALGKVRMRSRSRSTRSDLVAMLILAPLPSSCFSSSNCNPGTSSISSSSVNVQISCTPVT